MAHAVLGGHTRGSVSTSRAQSAIVRNRSDAQATGASKPGPPSDDSPASAADTAASYLRVLDEQPAPTDVDAALRRLTAPQLTTRALQVRASISELGRKLNSAGATFVGGWRLGWRVDSYSSNRAVVSIWTVGAAAGPGDVVAPDWSTTVCTLEWAATGVEGHRRAHKRWAHSSGRTERMPRLSRHSLAARAHSGGSPMRRRTALLLASAAVASATVGQLTDPAPAHASLAGVGCKVIGTIGEGWWGKACSVATGVFSVGSKVGGAAGKAAGNPLVQRGLGIAAIVAWVLGGARWTMKHMASVISSTTSPSLTAGWFSGVYLRIAGLALFFTMLFICAAAAEAVLRSDGALLARAVFAYLPLAALLTALAVPLTMLLLAATDQMSAGLATLAGDGMTHFLTGTSAWVLAGLTVADPFFAVMAGGLVVAAGGALWVEMLIREVAVYVVVAMLPLVFAAMVWPARRVWAVRSVEVLVALILSKVAVVAVLALGGAALAHANAGGLSKLLGGLALVILGAFSPWLLLRLIPLAEVASAAVGHVRGHLHATANVRTPEAALAHKTIERVSAARDGSAETASTGPGSVSVEELLEQMHRRAQAAENGNSARTTQRTAEEESPSANVRADGHETAADAPVGANKPTEPHTGRVSSPVEDDVLVRHKDVGREPPIPDDPNAPDHPSTWQETGDST